MEDQEALFHAYPCAYYVQSPSTISHANSTGDLQNIAESAFPYPVTSQPFITASETNQTAEASRFTLSHYSSSRGSNHSFLHEKKIIPFDVGSHETETGTGKNRLIIIGSYGRGDDDADEYDEDEEDMVFHGRRETWKSYFTYRYSDSCLWISLQILWRAMVSLGLALLVFYIATKPPSPILSMQMTGIKEFKLAEGVDHTGVATKILTFNCSIDLLVENKSNFFGLHIYPPLFQFSFGRLPFATFHGPKLYAERGTTFFKLSIGTSNKPMYGAGRDMEDMLESRNGLPIKLRAIVKSSFQVVWKLINPKYHNQVECLLVVEKAYDSKHMTQAYNSSCTFV